jgi:hypothetical protein
MLLCRKRVLEGKNSEYSLFASEKLACRMRELEIAVKKRSGLWLNVEMRETWLVSVCSGR